MKNVKLNLFNAEPGLIGKTRVSFLKNLHFSVSFLGHCFFLALTIRYGREGLATKKFDDSCLIFDAEILAHLCLPSTVKHYEEALAHFLLLINQQHTGELIIFFYPLMLDFFITNLFH